MKVPLTLSRPDGTPITNWEMWTRPKMDYQWEPERSAMELAKAWFCAFEISPPNELLQLLHSSARFTGLQLLQGIPERVTSLPERGEGRNHGSFGCSDGLIRSKSRFVSKQRLTNHSGRKLSRSTGFQQLNAGNWANRPVRQRESLN